MRTAIVLLLVFATFAAEAKNLSVRRNSNMEFGDVASSVSGPGTVVINQNADTKFTTGSVVDFGGTVARAEFSVTRGTAFGFATVTLPSSFTISKGGVTLTVDDLKTDFTPPAQFNNQGRLTFFVSGRVSIPTSQTSQSGLTGSFTVTVDDDSSGQSDSASANAGLTVLAPISISQTNQLNFGTVTPTSFTGTLTVNTNGTTTAVNVTEMSGNPVSQGEFEVTGDGNAAFSISLPQSATLTTSGDSMTVDNFNHDAGASPTIAGGGSRTVNIGARLTVRPDQKNGTYTGTYPVTVNYN